MAWRACAKVALASLPLVLALSACDPGAADADAALFSAQLDNTPPNNPITPAGAELGRFLFYDRQLSANGQVACASCHRQAFAFTDPERLSEGFDGGLTRRQAMSLVNVRFYENGRMFWDERASTLEAQVLMPIFDPVEMGLDEAELLARVGSDPGYQAMFEDAFGDEQATSERIAFALAQFVRSLVSAQSPFDEGLAAAADADADFPSFTEQENRGKALFFSGRTRCARCHVRGGADLEDADGLGGVLRRLATGDPRFAPAGNGPRDGNGGADGLAAEPAANRITFFGARARHNGLPILEDDVGVAEVTGDGDDVGRFKSPSLRNVELSAPYMHDGRFDTLEDVIDHYNRGVVDHPNLDERLQRNGEPIRMNLDDEEQAALVAFLRTLTDEAFLADPRLSDPFVE